MDTDGHAALLIEMPLIGNKAKSYRFRMCELLFWNTLKWVWTLESYPRLQLPEQPHQHETGDAGKKDLRRDLGVGHPIERKYFIQDKECRYFEHNLSQNSK